MGHKLLLVDDSPSMRQMVKIMLQKLGAEISLAENGQDGLDKLTGDTDLIITDYHMPVMGGLDFVEKVRQGSVNPQVPILVLTTEKNQELIAKGREVGASGWLVKPVAQDDLQKTVERFLKKVEF